MRTRLGEEADEFFASYGCPPATGLRVNGLKAQAEAYRASAPFALEPVPWADGGCYTDGSERPGKHPHHAIGLYYIQEPSAMLPAELLDVRPGHRVLDLCAAPGGKSTQLASKLRGRGVLVANDNAAERTKALAKNLERSGAVNAIVLNEEPERLAERFGAWFDRVLVDAPCSGEGMFRKDGEMVRQWERRSAERYGRMQRDILRAAARLVAPGGMLVYSTCTFAPEENEGTLAWLLGERPDLEIAPAPDGLAAWGAAPGRPDWAGPAADGLSEERLRSIAGAVRLWPHRVRGEGHFAVRLVRKREGEAANAAWSRAETNEERGRSEAVETRSEVDEERMRSARVRPKTVEVRAQTASRGRRPGGERPLSRPLRGGGDVPDEAEVLERFAAFRQEMLPEWRPEGRLLVRGDCLYVQPEGLPALDGLRVVRPGWLIGAATRHRFAPSQALAMGLTRELAARALLLRSDGAEALRYLRGETLQPDPADVVGPDGRPAAGRGWTLVCIDGHPAGWGRWDGTVLKNELLPGWRWE